MASGAIFSSLRRRRLPSIETFLASIDLSDVALVQTLISVAGELVSCFSDHRFPFQRKNSRSLVRKIEVFQLLLECLKDSLKLSLPSPTVVLCLKELYLLLYRSKILLDYCAQSSKLWLLLHNHSISGNMFLLFGIEEDELDMENGNQKKVKKRLITQEIAETFLTTPKDFCCPILLDLMCDPVIISTGQTYDRKSISRWMEEGHCTCPKTGQMLAHNRLVPNHALRNLIMQWCTANGIPYDPTEVVDASAETFASACPSRAVLEANRATSTLLIQQLADGSQPAKTIAAQEIRLLAKTGKENRAFIAEAGAIPYLRNLLSSPNAVAQENSITALLNLSIFDKNKSRIMDEEGCLGSIVEVLRFGHTTEAKENAAATLFSLSVVHDYKKRIADNVQAVEALAGLLQEGTPRGKKDAVTALFNLSTHTENCVRIIEAGAVTALVSALGNEGVSEEAAGALALIVRQSVGAKAVVMEEAAVGGLIGMMRCGTARGKENAVAVLLELCRSGGASAIQKVIRAPALAGLLQTLLFTGTKRARRKAASLARVFQRCENAFLPYGGLGVGYTFASNSTSTRDHTSFADDVSVPMSISLPVL
ncbi:putative aminoacyltransferase, E1 ubiquitin-activating enzyme [Lupinus albus]|uniref:RING-type E3 ubiquitin transferase n=1 Tax=Lupinus albus TaxID=3870 RepID=A0A6A4Q9Q8_LUPAL|nr:putative aminoacyltransferase, E1 ubiquitin-activating enzyme [Lupinus albus]